MKPTISILFLFGLLPGACFAQTARDNLSASSNMQNASLPMQTIGGEDLLGISVYDAPELSRPVRVGSDGYIRLPMLEDPIRVAGLFPTDVERAIASALRSAKVMVDPIVTVSVMEYQSRPINVVGALKSPLTFQAYGRVTLLDALARAGGVTDDAGPDVIVSRPRVSGTAPALMQRIPLKAVIRGTDPELNIVLHGGEEIRVPEMEKIYVVGNVRRPGAFAVRDGTKPSVLKMLALSEGLTPYAEKRAYVYRGEAGSEGRQEVLIELSRIIQRRAPDVPLEPSDVLYIPENSTRHGWSVALDKLLSIGGAGMGPALVYTSTR